MKKAEARKIPNFIYGTAWKENRTAELTKKAIALGFTAIDTANQKKHYREDFVGQALLDLAKQGITRESLFLQTKFTYVQGQDQRIPYDPSANFATQVKSSFASSLENLHTNYIDSFLLHGPSSASGMAEADWEVWATMEELYKSGQAKMVGVSNVALEHLHDLQEKAEVQPAFVQNRCYASRGWDKTIRRFCQENDIVYQGFSLLTANRQVLESSRVKAIAERCKATPAQVIFRFARQIGILPLTGTTNEQHMRQDLQIDHFELNPSELNLLESIAS